MRFGLLLCAALLLGWLLYGPFFAWLPAPPGFVLDRQGRVEVLHRGRAELTAAQRGFARTAEDVERTIGLRFTKAVRVVLCDTWEDLGRFTPWLPVNRGLGARTLPIGHIVYVTPLVRDRPDLDVFVRHELIHVLLHQHMPLFERLDGGQPAWLIEGLATHFGNPGSYPAADVLGGRVKGIDVRRLIAEGPRSPGGPMLFYAVSRDFVAWLDGRYGHDRVVRFVSFYVRDPARWEDGFVAAFGLPFEAALAGFADPA